MVSLGWNMYQRVDWNHTSVLLSRKRGRSQWGSALAGMPPHTHDFRLDHRGNVELFFTLLVLRQVHCWQMPPKRIRENPLLICWSIHKTGTVAKTSHSKDVSSSADSEYYYRCGLESLVPPLQHEEPGPKVDLRGWICFSFSRSNNTTATTMRLLLLFMQTSWKPAAGVRSRPNGLDLSGCF